MATVASEWAASVVCAASFSPPRVLEWMKCEKFYESLNKGEKKNMGGQQMGAARRRPSHCAHGDQNNKKGFVCVLCVSSGV